MFEQLDAAVDDLDIPLDGDALAAVLRIRDRLDAHLAVAAARYERSGQWEIEGATSMTAWLRDRAGQAKPQAHRLRLTGRRLTELPGVARAAVAGTLSGGQVHTIVQTVTDDTVALFADQHHSLVPHLAGLGPADTATVLADWQAKAAALVDRPAPHEAERSLHLSPTIGDRWEGTCSLDTQAGAVVHHAITLAMTCDGDDDVPRTAAHRRADALVEVCSWFLAHRDNPPGVRHRPHLSIVLTTDQHGHPRTGRLLDGLALPDTAWQTALCDCTLHRLLHTATSATLDAGRATRTISRRLWNALVIRDEHCRFPGCDRPVGWCEAHHVQPWEHGGRTDQANLVLVCSRHHHQLHKPGWHAKLLPDATLETTRPNGTTRTSRPPGQLRPGTLPEPRGPT